MLPICIRRRASTLLFRIDFVPNGPPCMRSDLDTAHWITRAARARHGGLENHSGVDIIDVLIAPELRNHPTSLRSTLWSIGEGLPIGLTYIKLAAGRSAAKGERCKLRARDHLDRGFECARTAASRTSKPEWDWRKSLGRSHSAQRTTEVRVEARGRPATRRGRPACYLGCAIISRHAFIIAAWSSIIIGW